MRVAAPDDEQERVRAQLVDKVAEAAEMRPVIEFVTMNEIFDPTKAPKSTRIVDLRPVE